MSYTEGLLLQEVYMFSQDRQFYLNISFTYPILGTSPELLEQLGIGHVKVFSS